MINEIVWYLPDKYMQTEADSGEEMLKIGNRYEPRR